MDSLATITNGLDSDIQRLEVQIDVVVVTELEGTIEEVTELEGTIE